MITHIVYLKQKGYQDVVLITCTQWLFSFSSEHSASLLPYDDVIKYFQRYWPFVRKIHR